jgi:hypothetical protein
MQCHFSKSTSPLILSEQTEKEERQFTNKKIGIKLPAMATQLKIILPALNMSMKNTKEQHNLHENRT